MGVGTFTMGEDTLTFIIPFDAYLPDDLSDHDLCSIYFDCAVQEIMDALPESYEPESRLWHDRHTCIIARNGFVNVGLTEWECNDLYVSFFPRDDDDRYYWGINPLAYHAMQSAHDKTLNRLAPIYNLRVRTSAWTTGQVIAA